MKKIIVSILTIAFVALSSVFTYAQTNNVYTIYVREGCQHCARVKAWVTSVGLDNNVVYIETFNNPENQAKLEAEFKKYNAPQSDMGVPFLLVSDTEYHVGSLPIIEFLGKKFNKDTTQVTEYQASTADTIFLLLGGTFLFAIVGYGMYSLTKKK